MDVLKAAAVTIGVATWMIAAHAQESASALAAVAGTIQRAGAGLGSRIEVEWLSPSLPQQIAGCQRLVPIALEGARLWGRTSIGLRCVQGGNGSAFVPVRIKVFAPALSAVHAMPAGHVLSADDVRTEEVDVAAEPGVALREARQAIGRSLARPLAAGSAIRAEALRSPVAVTAGDIVRVVYRGSGFSVTADGRALASAREGESVRAQTETGKLVTGTARQGRVVEVGGK